MLESKLELLRSIDSVIDFSRATVQLRILIALDEKSLTVSELVAATGLRRKTVLDALRKLEMKGLVKREGDRMTLTETGRAIYEALKSIIEGTETAYTPEDLSLKPSLYDTYNALLSVVYMLRALKVLGDCKSHRMPAEKLAKKLGVTVTTLDNHLCKFTSKKMPIFIKIRDPNEGIVYALTDLGLDLYSKLYPRKGKLAELVRKLVRSLLRR